MYEHANKNKHHGISFYNAQIICTNLDLEVFDALILEGCYKPKRCDRWLHS